MRLGLGPKKPPERMLPAPPPSCAPEVAAMVARVAEIKAKYVDPEVDWYLTHRVFPFFWFRVTGFLTIVLSAALPAVATFEWGSREPGNAKTVVVAVMSVAIAALAGLGSFFKWERSWRGRALSRDAIEGLCAKWELEIQNAYTLPTTVEQCKHIYLATSDLLANFRSVKAAESEEFFSGLQFPQSDRAGQNRTVSGSPPPPTAPLQRPPSGPPGGGG
jgi:hypothetical protein